MEFASYSAACSFVESQDQPENWEVIQECGIRNKVVWIAIDRCRFSQSEKD